MSIKVLKGGLLTSIQDLGRYGCQKHGVIVSGAMDVYSLKIANLLVGNDEGEGAMEITLLGPTLSIPKGTLFAITGGDLSPTVNTQPVPMWRPVYSNEDCQLKFGAAKRGCRAYLAVGGGYAVETVLGSKSTYLKAGIGGFAGRALMAGDEIGVRSASKETKEWISFLTKTATRGALSAVSWHVGRHLPLRQTENIVRVTLGRQYNAFTAESKVNFISDSFQVTTQSDRMGYRLQGPKLKLKTSLEMISEAVSFGTIQVPPDGNPIVLMADRQTAGGYPKIAQVIAVDLPIVAQSKPGSKLEFREVSLGEAEELYFVRERELRLIKTAIHLKLMEL